MKRYKEIVLKAEKGITFEILKETKQKVTIKVSNGNCSKNYMSPPIPKGYTHICGEWDSGFVIERQTDKSQFVWVPAESLNPNGTLDEISYFEKFGRRNYCKNEFSAREYHEQLTPSLRDQVESVKKYGGFYISRYRISKDEDGNPHSVHGKPAWVQIKFADAKAVARKMECREDISSHLIYGAEYDSMLEWFIESGAKTFKEVTSLSVKNSRKNYINNVYFESKVAELTQEQNDNRFNAIRGSDNDFRVPIACRRFIHTDDEYNTIGFRVALTLYK